MFLDGRNVSAAGRNVSEASFRPMFLFIGRNEAAPTFRPAARV